MAIKKLRRITLSGFRGFRYPTTLDFGRNYDSLLIFGRNAKGKSCIADAIEWFYHGSITELTKEGCTRIDYRHRLLPEEEDATVELNFSEQGLNASLMLPLSLRQNYSNESPGFQSYLD